MARHHEEDETIKLEITLASSDDVRRIEHVLAEILNHQHRHHHLLEKIMATLDQVLQDVTDESTRLDSLSTLIAGLKQQVADALAGTTLPPAVQAKVDAVFAQAESNKAKIDTALNTGVPVPAGGGGPGPGNNGP